MNEDVYHSNTRIVSLKATIFTLMAVIVIWGLSWPAMKLALQDMPPFWLGAIRMLIGSACLFAYQAYIGHSLLPKRRNLPLILSVSIFQMVIFGALMNIGLTVVGAGRAAIIAYTTPLWVVPIAIVFFKEPFSLLKLAGLLLGLSGVLLLFNPFSFDWSNNHIIIGNILLLLAALTWSISILHIRFTKSDFDPICITAYQMLFATGIFFILAYWCEDSASIHWSSRLFYLLFYIGPIATACGFVMAIRINRSLPAANTSLCMLGVPVIGLLVSALFLGEFITIDMMIAIIFILLGIVLISLPEIIANKNKT